MDEYQRRAFEIDRRRKLERARRRKKARIRRFISFSILAIIFCAVVYLLISSIIKHSKQASIDALSKPSVSQSTAQPTPTPEALPTPTSGVPDVYSLILVNKDNPLPDGYTIETASLPNGKEFDGRAIFDLIDMLNAAEADGAPLLVCSAYRSVEYQQGLLDKKISEYMSNGKTEEEAFKIATTIVAIPGQSEHNSGLAADIVAVDYQVLDDGFENTKQFKWLSENAHKYGFILRFPKGKEDITGIIYEPWHYRYVGIEYAEQIKNSGLCFEEWYAQQ